MPSEWPHVCLCFEWRSVYCRHLKSSSEEITSIVTIAGTGVSGSGYDGVGKLATGAQLYRPCSVFVSSHDEVYISEEDIVKRILKIDRNGIISTITGKECHDQLAVDSEFRYPYGLFVTDDDQVLFCDSGNDRIVKIGQQGMIITIAGNGTGGYNGDNQLATKSSINGPTSVFMHKNEIYFTDRNNNRIRKIDRNGIMSTIAGTGEQGYNGDDQPATSAHLDAPDTLFVRNDEVYFTDRENFRIRKILSNGIIKTIAGTGVCGYNGDNILAVGAQISDSQGIFVDEHSQVFFVDGNRIRKIDQRGGLISTIVGTEEEGYSGDVPFDFKQFPHIGPKKVSIKPFPKACYDISIKLLDQDY